MAPAKAPPEAPLTYNPTVAARIVGISRSSFYELLSNGTIPSFKLGRRRLVRHSALVEFLDRLESGEVTLDDHAA